MMWIHKWKLHFNIYFSYFTQKIGLEIYACGDSHETSSQFSWRTNKKKNITNLSSVNSMGSVHPDNGSWQGASNENPQNFLWRKKEHQYVLFE